MRDHFILWPTILRLQGEERGHWFTRKKDRDHFIGATDEERRRVGVAVWVGKPFRVQLRQENIADEIAEVEPQRLRDGWEAEWTE